MSRPLSVREIEITNLLVQGETVKTVAKKLGIATKKIETHKNNIYRKLNVHTSVQLYEHIKEFSKDIITNNTLLILREIQNRQIEITRLLNLIKEKC